MTKRQGAPYHIPSNTKKILNSNYPRLLTSEKWDPKLLGENTGGKFLDIILGNHVLDVTLKSTKATKANTSKWDYIKLNRIAKETKKTRNNRC